jgi:hypothetical protein
MSRARKITIGIAATLAALVLLGWFRWYVPTRYAVDIGAGMLAKQVCSCLYLANRDLDACRADQFASMDPIQVEVLEQTRRVRAFVPAFGERFAIFSDGLGCTLE